MTKLGKAIGLVAILAGLVAPTAGATMIDLRSPSLGALYHNQHSFVVTGVDGITVTFTVAPASATFTYNNGGGTDIDGLGVNYSFEYDEIETTERVQITFSEPVVMSSIFVTDLFRESRSGHWYNEMGWYSVDGATPPQAFFAPDGNLPYPATNGELIVPIGMAVNQSLVLSAPGYRLVNVNGHYYLQDHEYSLAAITYAAVAQPIIPEPVPEPDTLFLFGASALALAAAAKLRSRRTFAAATRSRSRRDNR